MSPTSGWRSAAKVRIAALEKRARTIGARPSPARAREPKKSRQNQRFGAGAGGELKRPLPCGRDFLRMFGAAKSKGKKPADPLKARFGLKRRALKPKTAAALDALLAENAELRARLEETALLADHDPLTSALNRRAFMRSLHQAMSYAERYGATSAVLFVDLDGFKAVNDNFGHAAGDAVLKHVAKLLIGQVRETDVVGRIGGDEFALVLQHTSAEDAQKKAMSLVYTLEMQPASHAGVTHRVGASIGVHAFAGLEDPEIALARADEAMYAAKHKRKREAAAR